MAKILLLIENEDGSFRICEEYFDKKLDIDTLLEYAIAYWGFRIPKEKDREIWNEIITRHWAELDDDLFYHEKPYCEDNKWIFEDDKEFYIADEDISSFIKHYLSKIKAIKIMKAMNDDL